MTGHMTSTGRGGAGNIADSTKSPQIQPADLETPTLKTSVVTTGRGGSGNMAPNKDPIETRARQDVGPIERRPSQGATHVGRGGAANIVKEADKTNLNGSAVDDSAAPQKSHTNGANGLAAKAKEFFKKA
ncbi:hypothetical protein F4804DRAFT_329282 [Jackrogersella minutella]|nr:hypothetical protein F4804DRAFT_329282 [Jackrogersella minutella]